MAASGPAGRAALPGSGALIFLTVGTQLPFDRLVRAADAWAAENPGQLFGQIAEPGPGGHRPQHFEWVAHLSPPDFAERFRTAGAIVAHAGMGTILSALAAPKPIVILPRRAGLGEQRNDHQLATARRFAGRPGVVTCSTEADLSPALGNLATGAVTAPSAVGAEASAELVAALRSFIRNG